MRKRMKASHNLLFVLVLDIYIFFLVKRMVEDVDHSQAYM